jgi:hypothetical protein
MSPTKTQRTGKNRKPSQAMSQTKHLKGGECKKPL